jgi:hypothetical protein
MPISAHETRTLSDAQVQDFITNGFVRIDKAFPITLAAAVRDSLWREMKLDPDHMDQACHSPRHV